MPQCVSTIKLKSDTWQLLPQVYVMTPIEQPIESSIYDGQTCPGVYQLSVLTQT